MDQTSLMLIILNQYMDCCLFFFPFVYDVIIVNSLKSIPDHFKINSLEEDTGTPAAVVFCEQGLASDSITPPA